jgi:hypothetical protein
VIDDSLRRHAEVLAEPRLAPLMRAVQVFGFHLATVDLRQSSDQHEAVVGELLRAARIEPDYSGLDEAARRALLMTVLNDARSLRVRGADYSAHRFELAIFDAAAEGRRRYGRDAIRHYIISHTEDVSDLLEVLLLQKEAGLLHGLLQEDASVDLIVCRCSRPSPTCAMRAHHARVLRPARRGRHAQAQRRRAGHHAGLLGQQQGRRPLHQQLGALPRRDRPGRAVRRASGAHGIRLRCSTAAAARWAAAAPATRPSWPSRRAPCAGRSA